MIALAAVTEPTQSSSSRNVASIECNFIFHLVHCAQTEPSFVLLLGQIQDWNHCRCFVVCRKLCHNLCCLEQGETTRRVLKYRFGRRAATSDKETGAFISCELKQSTSMGLAMWIAMLLTVS